MALDTEPSDADIIENVRRGDVQAYGLLVQRYERTALAAVLPIVRDSHAARDVVQDVFVACYLKLSTLRDASRFGHWLLKAARREAVCTARRRRWMSIVPVPDLSTDAPPTLFDDERVHLLSLVRRLPAHEQLIVGLRYFDGHGVNEIAAMTGRPVGTVTKQLSRAIQRLRDQLGSEMHSCPTSPSAIA